MCENLYFQFLLTTIFNSYRCYEHGSVCSDAELHEEPGGQRLPVLAITSGCCGQQTHQEKQPGGRHPVKAPCSLPSLCVGEEGCKEELARKAVMVGSHSEYWAFLVD